MAATGSTPFFAHPSSVVDPGAEIGEGTKIWHFCHVSKGAVIGRHCIVGQGCFIAPTVQIGDRVKIQNGVSVYDGVILEDEVFCGPHMIFTNVMNPRAFIERKKEFRPTRVCRGATIGAGAIVVCGHLVYGTPARQHGWVGKCCTKLLFDENGRAAGEDGKGYILRDGAVIAEEDQ
jgi:UDP-2-acetamido-3-amino-2,3-dideoxy-glucuronate N-acetyltransferase